jgi:signal transduction histidine kinase
MVSMTDAIPLTRTPTDLRALLQGTLEVLRVQAMARDVSLQIEAPPDLPLVRVDAEKIAWAVATLVGNALRYVRHGTLRRPGGSVVVRITVEPDAVTLAVEDDGPGIPPDKAANLFRRGAGVTHGTGLALMLIKDVLVAHGGRVDVKTDTDPVSSGTTIALRLPRDA